MNDSAEDLISISKGRITGSAQWWYEKLGLTKPVIFMDIFFWESAETISQFNFILLICFALCTFLSFSFISTCSLLLSLSLPFFFDLYFFTPHPAYFSFFCIWPKLQDEVYFVLSTMFIEELYLSPMIYFKNKLVEQFIFLLKLLFSKNLYVTLKSLDPQTPVSSSCEM